MIWYASVLFKYNFSWMQPMHEVEPRCPDKLGWLSSHAYSLLTSKAAQGYRAGLGCGPGDPGSSSVFTVDFGVYYLASLGLRSLKSEFFSLTRNYFAKQKANTDKHRGLQKEQCCGCSRESTNVNISSYLLRQNLKKKYRISWNPYFPLPDPFLSQPL